jgi:hypothetical protein
MPASRFNIAKPSFRQAFFVIPAYREIKRSLGNQIMDGKKIGRPPKPESDRRQQIGVRTSPLLKVRLEQIARMNGRSVAQEAELRLVQSFEADDLMGGPEMRTLLIQIASEIKRVEAATGDARTSDLATHIAATKLVDAVMRRAAPVPSDFARISAMEREIEQRKEERDRWCQVLAQFNVFSKSAFSAILGTDRYIPVDDEGQWVDPDEPGHPINEGKLKALREKRDDISALDADIAILSKELALAITPLKAEIQRGKQLADELLSQTGYGNSDGSEI